MRLPILFLALALVLVIALIACGRPLPTPTPPPTETPTETPIPSPTATPPPTGTATPPPSPTQIPPPPTATSTVVPTPTLTPINERIILEILYAETKGRNWWFNDNWLTDAPLGDWFGVTTNDAGHVSELNLLSNTLRGEIPPELAALSELTKLRLGQSPPVDAPCLISLVDFLGIEACENDLTGEIPAELGTLSNLTELNLSAVNLNGRYQRN